jgi:hypothetical protein
MPRRSARPPAARTLGLPTEARHCPVCCGPLWAANMARRSVTTLRGTIRLRLQVRSCRNRECPRYKACLRPEQEGRFALPQHEFGLDVIALVGRLRHAELVRRGGRSAPAASAISWTATTSCWRCPARTPAA